MSKFKLTLTLPKVNQDWWKSSKRELNELVENYNRDNWPKQRDPVTLKPWAPRKAPTGTWPVLRKTGEMQDTTKFKVRQNADGLHCKNCELRSVPPKRNKENGAKTLVGNRQYIA